MSVTQSSVAFVGPEDQIAYVIRQMAVNAAAATLGGSVDEQAIPADAVTAELVLRNFYPDCPIQAFDPTAALRATDEHPWYRLDTDGGSSVLILSLTTEGTDDGDGSLSPLLLAFLSALPASEVGMGLACRRDGKQTVSLLVAERGEDGDGGTTDWDFRRDVPVEGLFDFLCDWPDVDGERLVGDDLLCGTGEMAMETFIMSYDVIEETYGM